jgi:hypothetical protein
MVKKFTANCDFGGKKAPVTLYIGNPSPGSHPLQFQGRWLSDNKGGSIPPDIMQSFGKLVEISEKNRVSFDELCAYVIEEIQQTKSVVDDAKQATALGDAAKKSAAVKKAAVVPPVVKKAPVAAASGAATKKAPVDDAQNPQDKKPKDEDENEE